MSWTLTVMNAVGTVQSTITDATTPPVTIEAPSVEVDPPGDCVTMTLRGRPDQLNVPVRGILQYAEDGQNLFWGPVVVLPSPESLGAGPADSDSDALERYTVAGGKQLVQDSVVLEYLLGGDAVAITNAANASPIEITIGTANAFATGDSIVIDGVLGNTAANDTWIVTKVDSTHYTLDGSSGSGTYTSGGTATPTGSDTPTDVSSIAYELCRRYAHPALTVNLANFPSASHTLTTFYMPESQLDHALDQLSKTLPSGATWWVDATGSIHFEAN